MSQIDFYQQIELLDKALQEFDRKVYPVAYDPQFQPLSKLDGPTAKLVDTFQDTVIFLRKLANGLYSLHTEDKLLEKGDFSDCLEELGLIHNIDSEDDLDDWEDDYPDDDADYFDDEEGE